MKSPVTPVLRPRDPQAGLTLIETLVVIAIIGIATGATMMGLNGADRGARAQAEAVRLAQNLSLAVDEALISGEPFQLEWDESGYAFVQWRAEDATWQPADVAGLAARHDVRPPLRITMPDASPSVLIAASGSGPARQFDFQGNGVSWRVQFDGFTALASPQDPA